MKQQRGTGWQNLGFVVALAFWMFVIFGAPLMVGLAFGVLEPWLPR